MTDNAADDIVSKVLSKWGFWGVLSSVLGLLFVFGHVGGLLSDPQPSVGTQIGEIAGEIRRAAWDAFLGRETAAAPVPESGFGLRDVLIYGGPILGVLGIVLSMISGIRRENWHYGVYGASLGATAVLFHFFWMVALLICGVILLVAILENMGGIFGGGIFGG